MADTRAEFTETLNKMIEVEGPVCASFFIPTHEVGGEWRGDRIQLKNLLREAQDQFRQMDLPEEDVQNLLQPVQAMLQESSTWEQMRAGLSIFTTPDRHYIIRLPFSVEPQVVIGERFHIKPTLPWLARKGRFYILALSQNLLRLFECTPEGCAQLDPSMTPTSMQDALKYDDPERRTTLHTTEVQADGPSSGGSVVFHGHGVGSDNHEERLRRYFQAAADGVEEHLAGTNAPLLIYGVEENVAMYREVSKYPHLLEAALYGNPDDKDLAEIEREANKLVQAYQERKKLKAEERLNNHRGTDKVTQDLQEILTYAFQARIAYLFVSLDDQIWGEFEPESLEIQRNGDSGPGKVDLLNLSAIYTLKHGGEVYAVPEEQMPVDDSPIVALLRF